MSFLLNFAPILLFISVFLGSGLYFSLQGAKNAFYQVSPLLAILPAIILGWILRKDTTEKRFQAFLKGMQHQDIMTMCLIFLLAGAFSEITNNIGSMDALVALTLALIPPQFLMIGLFLVASFISTSIGTSMGTVAALAPIAFGICTEAGLSVAIGMGTIVSGAMMGDNLSIISDSTIAAVMSQKANIKARFKLNAKIAFIASLITIVILLFGKTGSTSTQAAAISLPSLWLISPYVLLILLASAGINVFIALMGSIFLASILGLCFSSGYTMLSLSTSLTNGFLSMHEIMLLSLLIGGLSGLASKGPQLLAHRILYLISSWKGGQKTAQLCIGKTVALFDLLLANNTIAIIFSGEIARKISKKYRIPPHYSAAWLDIFSCVFQGVIPYGAQILLASAVAGISPLSITPHVYYCYVLGIVSTVYILIKNIKHEKMI